MPIKMKENSLFAILLRSRWWISFLVAAAVGLLAVALMPSPYKPLALFSGAPFFVIGCMAAWRQFKAPTPAAVTRTLERATAMSSRDFLQAVEQGLRRRGYTVTPYAGPGADLRAEKDDKVLLLACRRWKAARHGADAVRELEAAMRAASAASGAYLALNELTEQARRQAADSGIDVIRDARLAELLGL
jgi:restriction system protein